MHSHKFQNRTMSQGKGQWHIPQPEECVRMTLNITHETWKTPELRYVNIQCVTLVTHHAMYVMHSHIKKGGESFGIGVSANARNSTSAKYLTSTMINRCNGERGWHNYQSNYSSSEPDYSLDEMLYEAPYETLYEAPYETSDHSSSPPA